MFERDIISVRTFFWVSTPAPHLSLYEYTLTHGVYHRTQFGGEFAQRQAHRPRIYTSIRQHMGCAVDIISRRVRATTRASPENEQGYTFTHGRWYGIYYGCEFAQRQHVARTSLGVYADTWDMLYSNMGPSYWDEFAQRQRENFIRVHVDVWDMI